MSQRVASHTHYLWFNTERRQEIIDITDEVETQVSGQGIRKITGDLPGWEATEEQKMALERMVLDVKRQDMPSDEDLEAIAGYILVQPKIDPIRWGGGKIYY